MMLSDTLQNIATRLINENICTIPLSEKSLVMIEQYMSGSIPSGDLCRRLSNIDFNLEQICDEAEKTCSSLTITKTDIIDLHEKLITHWYSNGFLDGYFFTSENTNSVEIITSYSITLEQLRKHIASLMANLLILNETAAQIRACSASYSEVYNESSLAIYAATLNRDVEAILNHRSTSLQAHASANECELLPLKLFKKARVCSKIISCVNDMITETSALLSIEPEKHENDFSINPKKISLLIRSSIDKLKNLNFE